ncbi:hypothetical protein L1049_012690 [Liquidambar formosana]|uniref:O-acyltransferase WSD1 C-terminal domain-containing protein n=1 Tax=Liquidambar formosana TaxID=63359 RepID=A0AAP0RJY1_LIQFO
MAGEGKKDEGATEKENNLPKNIRLTSVLFINLRQSAGIHALADMIEKGTKAKWGNDIGYFLCPLTIALCDNPLDYVRKAKAVMDRKKASLEATYTFSIAKLMLKFFGKDVGFPSHPTMWYSNVVGPQEEIGLFGYPVAYIAPSCYGQPSGFMIHAVSYANKMTLILSIAEGLVPDPHQLCDDLEESLKLIKDAVIAGGSSS